MAECAIEGTNPACPVAQSTSDGTAISAGLVPNGSNDQGFARSLVVNAFRSANDINKAPRKYGKLFKS